MTLFVYLTRNAVLRAREVYADVRASTSEGVAPALAKVLGGDERAGAALVNRVIGLHPAPSARLRALEDPRGLFSLGTFEAFGAGIAATIAFAEVVTLVDFFAVEALSTMWISALVFAPLAVGVVGLGTWRSTFGALAAGARPRGSWRLALALGVGFLVGQHFSLTAALGPDPTIISSKPWSLEILWTLVLLVGLGLFVAWIATSASRLAAGGCCEPVAELGLGARARRGRVRLDRLHGDLLSGSRDPRSDRSVDERDGGAPRFRVAGSLGRPLRALPVRDGSGDPLVRRASCGLGCTRARSGRSRSPPPSLVQSRSPSPGGRPWTGPASGCLRPTSGSAGPRRSAWPVRPPRTYCR